MNKANNAPPRGIQLHTKILIGMAVGIVLGALVGPNSPMLPHDAVNLGPEAQIVSSPADGPAIPQTLGLQGARLLEQRGDWLRVEASLDAADVAHLQTIGVAAELRQQVGGWVRANPASVKTYARIGQTLVDGTEWLGRLFLALIKMVVVPLVFFSLILGIASLGDFRRLGRMGAATLGFFTATTTLALGLGLAVANVIQPGRLMSEADRGLLLGSFDAGAVSAGAVSASTAKPTSFVDQLVATIPTNPFAALASANMLQCIFFAAMVGIALTLIEADKSKLVVNLCDGVNDAMVALVHIAMKIAPVGVAALLFQVVGTTGLSVLAALTAYAGVVLLGLLAHILFVYVPVVRFGAGLPFLPFLRAIRAPLVLGFSTSSSSACLPVTMRAVEDNLQVRREISTFVLPIGATVNMDGTALYQGVAAIFIAQLYGLELGWAEQATIVVSATMASIGAAGVPGAGMLTLAMVLAAVGVPVEGVALVIGIDRILDMFRTVTNVIGDATATVFIARLQGAQARILSPEQDATDPKHGIEGVLAHPAEQQHPVQPRGDE